VVFSLPRWLQRDYLALARLAVECRRNPGRHTIRSGYQGAIRDVRMAGYDTRHGVTKQAGDRQLGKAHLGRRRREAVP